MITMIPVIDKVGNVFIIAAKPSILITIFPIINYSVAGFGSFTASLVASSEKSAAWDVKLAPKLAL